MQSIEQAAQSVANKYNTMVSGMHSARLAMQERMTPSTRYADVQAIAMQSAGIVGESNASERSAPYEAYIAQAARQNQLNPNLIRAVIQTESSFRPNLTSDAGANGLMQLMPGTAEELGVTDRSDPAQNIAGGSKYLAQMLKRFDGDYRLALAAYRSGPGYVEGLGITPNTTDLTQYDKLTSGGQGYVSKVLRLATGGEM